MNLTPKTIQIFLPGGDPRGIRIAEITTRILQVIEVPRSLLSDFTKMEESNRVAVYFLFGESEEDEQRVYIGQTGDLRKRLKLHNKEKDFWERALVVISKTNSLTQTHALFLEWYCLTACREAGRFSDENGNSGSKPHTPAPLEAECLEVYDTAKTLLATLGYPLFSPLSAGVVDDSDQNEIYYCQGSSAEGSGRFTSEGFVVLKGSSGRKDIVDSIVGTRDERRRIELIENGVCGIEGDRYVFQKDFLFGSPSVAAATIMGRSANGWYEWKDSEGKTLHELKRQSDDS